MTSTNWRKLNWGIVGAFVFCAAVLWAHVARAEVKVSQVEIESKLSEPFGVDFDPSSEAMYVIEYGAHRLIRVKDGKAEVVAGNGQKGFGGDGGPAGKAQLNSPHNIAVTPNGDVYIADSFNSRVRKIGAKSGVISTFAGTGQRAFGGDGGFREKAEFGNIYCVAFDPGCAHMYLADLDNRRIRAIDMKSGVVSTVAGNGKKGVPKDGADAKEEPLVDPRAVAADDRGNVYVLERSGNALRVVDSAGKIKTVAGTGKVGYGGDGGPAREALMNGPKHLWVEKSGDVLIADTENHVIRKYRVGDGKMELVTGTGKSGAGLSEDPKKCQLARPHGVIESGDGSIYIADSENGRVLVIR